MCVSDFRITLYIVENKRNYTLHFSLHRQQFYTHISHVTYPSYFQDPIQYGIFQNNYLYIDLCYNQRNIQCPCICAYLLPKGVINNST